ncbi:MAG: protein kinase domain-containing protein [Armatimonadota bacterium]
MALDTIGKYQIIREIGRSNDVVYEAVDSGINRRIALKELLLPPNLVGAQKRERIERFYREARSAGSLSHPNIVTIYEVGEDRGKHFIAMEFLEGQTLRTILDIEKTFSIERAASIALQVCDALSYAHSKGVVHRDIKPDNIQILPGNRVKITDFGIARIMEEPSITIDGQVFGTPSYMSPEQVAGKPLDPRSDLFSLGVVLYEMLVGRKPFVGDTVVTITYNIMNQDIILPPGIPAHFERVLRRSLAKDPAQRYQSASEMAYDLNPDIYKNVFASNVSSISQMQMNTGSTTSFNPAGFSINSAQTGAQTQSQSGNQQSIIYPVSRKQKKTFFSNDAIYFIKVAVIAITISLFLAGFIWLISAGYSGFQQRQNITDINVYLETAKQYFDQKSYQAAIEQYTRVLGMTQDQEILKVTKRNIAVCYINLGNEMDSQGSMIQAVNFYKQAISIDGSSAEAYLNLGIAFRKMGSDDDAVAAWTKTAEVGFGSAAAQSAKEYIALVYHDRGDAAYRQGNKDAAINWWRSAIEVAPGTQAGMVAQQKIDQVIKE